MTDWNNKEEVLEAVKNYGPELQYASEELRADREVALAAVKNNGDALEYASEELRSDREVVLAAVKESGGAHQYASEELKNDKEVVLTAVKDGTSIILKYTDPSLLSDKEFVLSVIFYVGSALEHVDKKLQGNKEVVSMALNDDGSNLKFAHKSLKADKKIVLMAVENNGLSLKYASDELKQDKDIVISAIGNEASALKYANKSFRADKDLVLAIIKENERYPLGIIESMDESLRKDKEVLLQATEKARYPLEVLEYADKSLLSDKEFVIATVKQNCDALEFASDELKNDKEVVMAAVKDSGDALEYASKELRADKEVVMAAVNSWGYALEYASEELRADREVVMAAVKDSGDALEYASKELRADKEVVLAAVNSWGYALEYASEELRTDIESSPKDNNNIAQQAKEFFSEENDYHWNDLNELVEDHIMNNPEYVIKLLQVGDNKFEFLNEDFETFPKKIRDNLDVMKVAVHINPRSIEYMSKDSIYSELFMIIFNDWSFQNGYCDEDEISAVTDALIVSSCNEDKDLIKQLIDEVESHTHDNSLPFSLISACSSTLFKEKDILLGLLKNFNEEVNGFLCETGSNKNYSGDGYSFHWTEVISCEHFSKKIQGSGLLKDPDIIDLLKNISTGIEKHFTLMHKENQMVWVENNEDKHWIMLFRELSKG